MRITKKEVLAAFKESYTLQCYGSEMHEDKIAKRESWYNYTDMLCKENVISESQYKNWSNPF